MSKYYLIFGGIAGLLSATLEYLLFNGTLGFDKVAGVLFGKILAMLGCIVFAVILIKKVKGTISFMRTSFSGLMIALVCASVSGIGYSYMAYPDGSFFEDAIQYTIKHWEDENADKPEELARKIEVEQQIRANYSVKHHTMLELGMFLVIGVVATTFLAGIVADRKSLEG